MDNDSIWFIDYSLPHRDGFASGRQDNLENAPLNYSGRYCLVCTDDEDIKKGKTMQFTSGGLREFCISYSALRYLFQTRDWE